MRGTASRGGPPGATGPSPWDVPARPLTLPGAGLCRVTLPNPPPQGATPLPATDPQRQAWLGPRTRPLHPTPRDQGGRGAGSPQVRFPAFCSTVKDWRPSGVGRRLCRPATPCVHSRKGSQLDTVAFKCPKRRKQAQGLVSELWQPAPHAGQRNQHPSGTAGPLCLTPSGLGSEAQFPDTPLLQPAVSTCEGSDYRTTC